MPITTYEEHEVEHLTRLLARCHETIRDKESTDSEREAVLKTIERTLGWDSPPPMKSRPPDQRAVSTKKMDWMS